MKPSDRQPRERTAQRSSRIGESSARRGGFRALSLVLVVAVASTWMTFAGSPESLREALEAQRALVAANPNDAELLNDLGNLLGLAGQLAEAEEAYRRALAIEPDTVTGLYNLGLVLQEQGRSKEARKTLEAVIATDPRHAWAHYQLGTLYAAQKNRSRALEHYVTAFALDRSLTSPKVNPHIVENRLVTAALLQMYVSSAPSTQAPRLYQQPGEVAELLLPELPTASEDPTTPVETPKYRGSFAAPPAFEEDDLDPDSAGSAAPSGASGRTRTLDEDDLRRGSYIPPSTSDPSFGTPERPGTGTSRASSPVPGLPEGSGPTTFGTQIPGSGAPATGSSSSFGESGSFVPGVQSTGRLDIELLPATRFDSRASAS